MDIFFQFFFFSSRRRHTRSLRDWSSDVCSSDLFARGLQKNGIGFRTVTVNSLRDVREDAAWPADLKWIRDSYPNMRGTPWFFVINGRSIQMAANSTDMWRTKLL